MVAITRELATFVAGLRYESLPTTVQERTRFLILDLVGNMLRGRHEAESTPPLLAAARALGLTGGSAAVFGDSQRYTPAGAALINGAMAHSLDFDDTHAAGTLHPEFAPGTWMMLSDHLNLTGTSPLLGGANFVDMSAVYSPEWRARFRAVAAEEKLALEVEELEEAVMVHLMVYLMVYLMV
jgi:2-methylcitrate dehydratase PrpD